MKLQSTFKLWLLLAAQSVLGQEAVPLKPRTAPPAGAWLVGVDVSRMLINNAAGYSGPYLEGIFKYKNPNRTRQPAFTAALGYSKTLHKDTLYLNMVNYRVEGWYVKGGLEFGKLDLDQFSATFGAQVVASSFTDSGDFFFQNGYFGTETVVFLRAKSLRMGVEGISNLYFPLGRGFLINVQSRLACIFLTNPAPAASQPPMRYTPGFGLTNFGLSGRGNISGGISLQLLYRFGG